MPMFETTNSDIERLDALRLTSLLIRLLTLEAEQNGIPRSCIHGSLQITASDGGEDGHIRWESGPDHTEWIPNRYTMFQCKATDTSPAVCEREVVTRDGTAIKPRVDEVLATGGAYILFCTTSCNTTMADSRVSAIRTALQSHNKSYANTADIRVYDANKIALWANQSVSAITFIRNANGAPLISGLKTWQEWSGYSDNSTAFVSDNQLDSYIATLRTHIATPRRLARIIGLSGVGKTRLALETFRPPLQITQDIAQHALSSGCVYVDAATSAPNLPALVSDWVRAHHIGTLVVDNCDYVLHRALRREIEHAESRLSLLTLDYSVEDHQNDHPYIQIDRVSDGVIKEIVKQAYPGFNDADINRVVEFAQGFPRMAVLIAQAQLDHEHDIGRLRDPDLINRLLWQRGTPDNEARRVISVCSLFEHLGYAEDVAEQRIFAAEQICRMDSATFFGHAEAFIQRRILDKRNRYIRVVPFPLAITLAAEWLQRCPPEFARTILASAMPAGMAEALCDQLAHLNSIPRAQEIVREMYGESGPFGQAEVLLSEQGSRLFRSLVEVNPDACVESLYRAIGDKSREELLEIGPARRNLMWSLEKLCFWEDTFPRAARLMLALAVAENESWGNNATNKFLQLYHLHLSGTQAAPKTRIEIIDEALSSDSIERKHLAIGALGSALETRHFYRMGGVEKQGSRPAAEDWKPSTYNDIYSYQGACIDRLKNIILNQPEFASFAKNELGSRIRGLISDGINETLEKSIIEVGLLYKGFWPEALQSIKNAIQYDGEKMPPETLNRVKSWLGHVTPQSLPDRIRLTVSIPDFEHCKIDNNHYIDVAKEKAVAFADELANQEELLLEHMPLLLTGEQRQGYAFGQELAQRIEEKESFIRKILECLRELPPKKINPSLICGFLAGLSDRILVARVLDEISKDDNLVLHLVEATRLSRPEENDLERVIESVKQKRIPVHQLNMFSYNSVLDHLPSEIVIRFCEEISQFEITGTACAFGILYMFCFQSKERWDVSVTTFRRLLMTPGLLYEISKYPSFGDHAWEETVSYLLQQSSQDPELAVAIAQDIVEACAREEYSHNMKYFISEVLKHILPIYFDHIWPILGSSLICGDWRLRMHLGHIFGGLGNKEETGEVIAKAPLQPLLTWCEQNRPEGPHVIARILPLILKREENVYTWHPYAVTFLEAFGDDEDFLKEISANLQTFSWTGSIIPYYEMQIQLMAELADHRIVEVKKWARSNTEWLKKRSADERKIEEEHDLGIF